MEGRIEINPITRVEGHAKVTIDLDDRGDVARARFHVLEFRGFEKLCEGRPFHEMPGIMARVCGICPVSHILASSKAGDRLLGIEVPPAAVLQRRLANYGQVLQSHALSFFHLSSPDLLLGMDADPRTRNLFGLVAQDPDFARRGIRLRQFGQRIIELVGGSRIHPSWSVPGGVARVLSADACNELKSWLAEAYATVDIALSRLKQILDRHTEEVEHLGSFPSLFLGMVDDEGHLAFYDGRIRIVDAEGNVVADRLDPSRYPKYLDEASESWSFMKHAFYKPMGYPVGAYRVGPLARLNVATTAGTPLADRELREFKQRSAGAVCASFHYHLARLIEMLHSVERIEELLNEPELKSTEIRAKAQLNRRQGIGAAEAPRGTLFHHYEVDDDGLIVRANLLIATLQNNAAINRAVEQAAKRFVRADGLQEGMLNRVEAAIRCFDPCLSCSTHALGQMPLSIEVLDASGAIIERITRPD
ncbi:MAG: Ni/Fe hydrogenase subunit alpha [Deltaproteobacteria bacterium]|nr:Ni/Fe hydrogenase subunit alpha [Deltaproteobacteria bacterium]